LWWVQQIFWTSIYLWVAYWLISWSEPGKAFVDSAFGTVKNSLRSIIPGSS
jgi:hypothetical protein